MISDVSEPPEARYLLAQRCLSRNPGESTHRNANNNQESIMSFRLMIAKAVPDGLLQEAYQHEDQKEQ